MISYQPLLKLLRDKNISLAELRDEGGFSSTTLSKINKHESVALSTLDRICMLLDVPIEAVVKIEKDNDFLKRDNDGLGQIKSIRKAQGLTQTQIASIIGVTQAQISIWERDGVRLTADYLHKLKTSLNVSEEELKKDGGIVD